MSHTASESLPPLTATSTRSPGCSMSWSEMAFSTWRRHSCWRCSAQKLALCRGRSMTAGPRQTRHFDTSTPRDDRADLDGVGVVEAFAPRHERPVADDEVRLPVEAEVG